MMPMTAESRELHGVWEKVEVWGGTKNYWRASLLWLCVLSKNVAEDI